MICPSCGATRPEVRGFPCLDLECQTWNQQFSCELPWLDGPALARLLRALTDAIVAALQPTGFAADLPPGPREVLDRLRWARMAAGASLKATSARDEAGEEA